MTDREKYEQVAREIWIRYRDTALHEAQPHKAACNLKVAIADAIEQAVAEERKKSMTTNTNQPTSRIPCGCGSYDATWFEPLKEWMCLPCQATHQIAEKQAEIDRLKAELERVTGERDEQGKNACELFDHAKAAQAERDTLRAQLEAERRGHPLEQPLTDMPLDRQIVLLNRQLTDKRAQLEEAQQLVSDCIAPVAEVGKRRSAFLQKVGER